MEIDRKHVLVVRHLADAVKSKDDALLRDVHHLNLTSVVIEHGESDGKLCRFCARAFAVDATGELTHLHGDFVGSGLVIETERLGLALCVFAPNLVVLHGLVAGERKADGRASWNAGRVQVTTAGTGADCGLGAFRK